MGLGCMKHPPIDNIVAAVWHGRAFMGMSCVQHPLPIDNFIDASKAKKRSASGLPCHEVTTYQLHRRRCHRAGVAAQQPA